jgi:flagellar hook-basal body complex protein FliE
MITPMIAARAYAAAQSQLTGDPTEATAAPAAGGMNFGEMLKGVMSDTIQTSRAAEAKIVDGVQGKADLVDVVTAISSAEASLQTVMAVRDQVISAYQQVMSMQI